MTHPVIVSGALRSGASAVASMLHTMGCPMAVTIMAPVQPRWRAEWEDVPVSYMTHESFPLGSTKFAGATQRRFGLWLHDYFQERKMLHDGMQAQWSLPPHKCIGAKSPLFLFAWEHIRASLPKLRTVIVHRTQAETAASILSSYPPEYRKAALDTNSALHELAVHERASLDLTYEEVVADPEAVANQLADIAEVEDRRAILRAASMIKAKAIYTGVH